MCIYMCINKAVIIVHADTLPPFSRWSGLVRRPVCCNRSHQYSTDNR